MTDEKTQPPVVLVVWEDIKTSDVGAWIENDPEAPYLPHLVTQVGFLLKDEPEYIRLTQAWHADLIAPDDTIPRGCIRSITPLKVPKAPRKKPTP